MKINRVSLLGSSLHPRKSEEGFRAHALAHPDYPKASLEKGSHNFGSTSTHERFRNPKPPK